MYIIDIGSHYKRPKFKTLEEANKVANEIQRKTGLVFGIYEEEQFKRMLKEERG